MGLGWCGTSALLWVNGGALRLGSGQALTSVRPERSGTESKGWGRGCAVLRLCFGSTGSACPFGLAYALPSTSLHSAVLRSASLRTNGGGCFAQALRLGSGCSGVGASLFVSPVKTWSGLTSVRPERSASGAEGLGLGWLRSFDFALGQLGRPFDAAQDRLSHPFALSGVERSRRVGVGLVAILRLCSGWAGGALAHLEMAYAHPSTSLHSAVLRSASLRTNGEGALRSGPSTRLRMLGGAHRMRGGGCLPGGVGLRAGLRLCLGWVGFGLALAFGPVG